MVEVRVSVVLPLVCEGGREGGREVCRFRWWEERGRAWVFSWEGDVWWVYSRGVKEEGPAGGVQWERSECVSGLPV